MKNKDTYYLTALRVLAMFAVVTYHVGSGGDTELDDIVRHLVTAWNSWCVPSFLMITGALFLSVRPPAGYSSFLHRAGRTAGMAVFWTFVCAYISLTFVHRGGTVERMMQSLLMDLTGNPVYAFHLWYLYAMAGIYLLIPPLQSFWDHAEKREQAVLLGIFLLCSIGLTTVQRLCDLEELWAGSFHWFTGYTVYLLLGGWLHRYPLGNRGRNILNVATLGVLVLLTAVSILRSPVYDAITQYLCVPPCVLTCALFVNLRQIEWENHPKLRRLIDPLAKYSLAVYILHVPVIQAMRKVFHLGSDFAPLFLSLPVIMLLAVYMSWRLGAVGKRIPVLRRLL